MSNLGYLLAGLSVGFWASAFFVAHLIEQREKRAVKNGFLQIDDTVYRLEKYQSSEAET